MVLTPSTMIPLGSLLPEFSLPDTDDNQVNSQQLADKPVLIAFVCNHCPYVKHIAEAFTSLGNKLQQQGMEVLAIHSNDWQKHPDDAPQEIRKQRAQRGDAFAALLDEDQQVARVLDARCTPDFFVYNRDHKLVYRGQFDGSRPGSEPATGKDLAAACDAILNDEQPDSDQQPSIGCNIKWRPGNAPV